MQAPAFFHSIITFLIALILLLPAGCEDKPESAVVLVDHGKRTLRIGLIPEVDIFSQKKRYEPLARYLGEKSGARVEMKILSRYGNIIDNFVDLELDGAFFGSFTGALALKKLGVIPVARPESKEGISTYYGLVFVRKDEHIKSAAQMKGKRFAFVDRATTAGWLLPLHYFRELGIVDYEKWFSETYFSGTHGDAIYDVLLKKADIGAAKNTIFYRLADQDHRILNELEILTTSPPVPENGLAVRPGLEKNLVDVLRGALLGMDQDSAGKAVLEAFGSARFVETTAKDYEAVVEFAEQIGIDLAGYEYINN